VRSPPHNLTYTVIGAGLLWVGWFGFNAGSAMAAGGLAASAFAATHFSAAAGTIAWAGMEWITRGKPSVLGACSGAVAGLVCITPASGFVQPMPAIGMGLAAGMVTSAATRLSKTLQRFEERATGTTSIDEAVALSLALDGRYADAAAAAEPLVGTLPLVRLFLTALRLEYFDIPMALRLIDGGQTPEQAIRSGFLVGKYNWWPAWLLRIVTERALAGTLDLDTIHALDQCAYADLSPFQARLARRLLNRETELVATAAQRLEDLGERAAADRLRRGDLDAVALAARLVPL
jgi:hypothetical protein